MRMINKIIWQSNSRSWSLHLRGSSASLYSIGPFSSLSSAKFIYSSVFAHSFGYSLYNYFDYKL